jgi:hypothetical protein
MLRVLDLPTERPVSLRDAARRFGEFTGKQPHVATVYRWVTHGVRGVKLETLTVAGSRVTTLRAIERFIEATSAAGSLRRKGGAR